MRYYYRSIGLIALLVAAAPLSCAPGVTDAGDGVIDAVAGITDSITASGDVAVASDTGDFVDQDASASTPPPTAQSMVNQVAINGSVADDGDYRLFDLGTALFGDEWTIAPNRHAQQRLVPGSTPGRQLRAAPATTGFIRNPTRPHRPS